MSTALAPVLLTLLSLATACGDLAEVVANTCGNLVVEAGEQCDGQPSCGDTGPAACRFTCEAGVRTCPGARACSVEGVCVASAGYFVPYDLAPRYQLVADRVVVGDLDGDRRDDLIGVGASLRVRFGAPRDPLLASYEKRIRPPTGAAAFGELDGRPGLDVVFPTADGVFTLVARGRELDAVPYASAASLPDDRGRACAPSPGWAACRTADLDRDGRMDRVGFVADRDNLELELGRAGPPVAVTLDTVDVITDVTTGDLDGDGFGDIGFSTRSTDGVAAEAVHVVYGGPQPQAFATARVLSAPGVTGVAAADLDDPPDGLDDLAVARADGAASGVVVYLGDSARDLSAPFRLDGSRPDLDVPYAIVAGEFVGGPGSGIDVMAYARNPRDRDRTYLWWLRGLGAAQLAVGATDPIDSEQLRFFDDAWRVADLVADDPGVSNGPDEVIGLSSLAPGCRGPAVTAAVPSARATTGALLRSACLAVDGDGWTPALIGVLDGEGPHRAVALARRDRTWWLGEAERLDDATATGRLDGISIDLDPTCRDPQLWPQTPNAATSVSWVCDGATDATVIGLRQPRGEPGTLAPLITIPRGATHLTGDFNGDGLTDVVLRADREVAVLLQCSTDLAGTIAGC